MGSTWWKKNNWYKSTTNHSWQLTSTFHKLRNWAWIICAVTKYSIKIIWVRQYFSFPLPSQWLQLWASAVPEPLQTQHSSYRHAWRGNDILNKLKYSWALESRCLSVHDVGLSDGFLHHIRFHCISHTPLSQWRGKCCSSANKAHTSLRCLIKLIKNYKSEYRVFVPPFKHKLTNKKM